MHQSDAAWIQKNRTVLERELGDVQQHLGSLEVHTNVSGAELWINGERVAALPADPLRLATGHAAVEVRASGYMTVRREVDLAPRALVLLEANLAPVPSLAPSQPSQPKAPADAVPPAHAFGERSTRRTLGWVALGTAGVLLMEGTAAQIAHQVLIDNWNDDGLCVQGTLTRMQRCGEYKGGGRYCQTFAIVGLALGGAAAAFSG